MGHLPSCFWGWVKWSDGLAVAVAHQTIGRWGAGETVPDDETYARYQAYADHCYVRLGTKPDEEGNYRMGQQKGLSLSTKQGVSVTPGHPLSLFERGQDRRIGN